jgi:hypothetical protein
LATATFTANLTAKGNSFAVTTSSPGRTVTASAIFTLTNLPGAPVALGFTAAPASVVMVHANLGTVRVAVLDTFGNTVSSGSGTISAAFASGTGGIATLGGTLSQATVNGVATFSDLNVNHVGRSYVLQFSDGSLAPLSAPLTVVGGPAASLALTANPASTAGSSITLTLTAYDALGNPATAYAGTVSFSSSDAGATLPATYTFQPADFGAHTFTGATTLVMTGPRTIRSAGSAVMPTSPSRRFPQLRARRW